MGNAPSSGLRTGTSLSPGYAMSTRPLAQPPAQQLIFGDILSNNNNNVPKKQFGFYSTQLRPQCCKDVGHGEHTSNSNKAETIFDQPFKGVPPNTDQIKDDPHYKKFMNDWQEMVPELQAGEHSDEDEASDDGNDSDTVDSAPPTTTTTTGTVTPAAAKGPIGQSQPSSRPSVFQSTLSSNPYTYPQSAPPPEARSFTQPQNTGLGLSQLSFHDSQQTTAHGTSREYGENPQPPTEDYTRAPRKYAEQQQQGRSGYAASAFSRASKFASPAQNIVSKFSSSAASMTSNESENVTTMGFTQQLRGIQRLSSTSGVNKGAFVSVLDDVFTKAYKAAVVEKGVYEEWEKNDCFKAKKKGTDKFSLVLPPPNITGTLHLGHALTATIQDSLARWHRMRGRDVLWVPGFDHAGIATQTVVEKWLKQTKNVTRHEIGREQFLTEVTNWQNEKRNIISAQLRKLGASLDWSREIFTMDERHNDAVVEALVRLWKAGLVYRKETLINWSCHLSSAISDIEVDKIQVSGPTPISIPGYDNPVVFGEITEFAYKVCDSDEEVVVATTRPETMLGDVAVAVHPDDPRYSHMHNAKLWHPYRNTAIPVICDTMVDMQFGTGAVKITPGHNHTDWEVAERHRLPLVSVIDERGCITSTDSGSMFQGMKRFEAREAIRNELAKANLLRSIKPHSMILPICSRSGDVVEYLLKYQWFISCKKMAEKASDMVREGNLQIEPLNHQTTWFNWMDNIRDWCISRQLWWGHRLPMYCATKGNTSVWLAASSSSQAISDAATQLGGEPDSVLQDPDVLDTWFSSAIYPLSALGWPNQVDDLQHYYPLDLMETGHDILFFWVARMVMLGVQLTDQLPFKKVLLHGVICDAQGRKMSKSLGNVISPEDIIQGIKIEDLHQQVVASHSAGIVSAKEMKLAIEGQKKLFPDGIPECGTDALRFTLLSHNTKSHFISFDVKECETNARFCNKIWQATRYTLNWSGRLNVASVIEPVSPGLMDRWILSQLSRAVHTVTSALETGDFYLATAAIKHFLYTRFCDVYVETTKPALYSGSEQSASAACSTLLFCLDTSLRLVSPIMPFICEQLYKHLPGNENKSAMLAEFPVIANLQKWENPDIDATVEMGLDVLSAIRSMKKAHGFHNKCIPVEVETVNRSVIETMKGVIESLANCSIEVTEKTNQMRDQTITDTLGDHTLIHIRLEDIGAEAYDEYMKTLIKKEAKIQKSLNKIVENTSKKGYDTRVSKDTQLQHTEMIQRLQDELQVLRSFINNKKQEQF